MRILVIGGTRFIGPSVVATLIAAGHDVTCFHRGKSATPEGAHEILGDRHELASFAKTLGRFDAVVDMIPMTVADAQSIVDLFGGRRITAISSCDVYRAYARFVRSEPGDPDPVPLTEDAPVREKLYPLAGVVAGGDSYDKLLVERTLAPVQATILRLPFVYGPRDGQHRLRPYLQQMDAGQESIVLDSALAPHRVSRVYVDHAGAWIARAATEDRAAGQLYNVADHAYSSEEWIRAVADEAGWTGRVVTVPAETLPDSMNDPVDSRQDLTLDASRIHTLGTIPLVPLEESIRRTIAWERLTI